MNFQNLTLQNQGQTTFFFVSSGIAPTEKRGLSLFFA